MAIGKYKRVSEIDNTVQIPPNGGAKEIRARITGADAAGPYTSVTQIVDSTNATVDQHYSSVIEMEGYRNLALQFTGSTGTSGVVFTLWGTLNTSAAVPADGAAAPSSDWVDISTDVLGAASITLDGGASGLYFIDTDTMPDRLIVRYDCDHATNSTSVFIRKY